MHIVIVRLFMTRFLVSMRVRVVKRFMNGVLVEMHSLYIVLIIVGMV